MENKSEQQVLSTITKAAHRNHEEILPNHQSSFKQTDPEFIAFFDNFAFDEVIAHDDLPVKTRLIAILASTIGSSSLTEFKVMMGAAMNVGVTPFEIKEIVYQSVAYVGVAKAIDFLHATNEFLTSKGVTLPLEGQSTTTPDTRMEKGLAVQKEIFGEAIDKMYEQSPKDQLHIQHFLSGNCFGDYYTRTGLDSKMRELVTFAILISMGGVESQVEGHVQGNLNVGNDKQFMLNVITQLLPYIGYPRTLNAIKSLNKVTTK